MDAYEGQDQLIGQTIGNYLVKQKLGEGGMGSVYLAEHPTIGKKVALKVLHAEFSTNEDVARRFFHEAKAVNNIGHPNIVDIVDYGVIQSGVSGREQLVYFIMEYLAGVTLSDLIRGEAPLPPERALTISMQAADALSASHRCGIVHRDLKPDNIILQQRGRERDFVKLLDFGIAKLSSVPDGSHRTRTGIAMGTPAYMSPEQCEGKATVDQRTDIYALGIVLYEMLTGRVPFTGEGYGEILVQHLTQIPVRPSSFRMLPPHVEVVVMKALEKRPDMRYPTMDEFMRAMADPVGYVEAHGGVGQFLGRQLMPSSAPLPPLRSTPMPGQFSQPTPPPGSLVRPSGIYAPGSIATPAPTTLGTSAGEMQKAGRSRAGFWIASLIILAAAGAGVAIVATGNKVDTSEVKPAGDPGSDTGDKTVDRGSDEGSAKVADTGSAPANTGSGTPSNSGSATTAGTATETGSATPQVGSAGSDVAPVSSMSTITLSSDPPGAEIYVDGKKIGKQTPSPFEVERTKKSVTITLKLDKHEDVVLKKFAVDSNVAKDVTMKRKGSSGGRPNSNAGRGSNANPGKGSGSGRRDDTGLERPD